MGLNNASDSFWPIHKTQLGSFNTSHNNDDWGVDVRC